MSVAFDQISNHPTGDAATMSWTHTPVGTPKGILVTIVGDENVDDVASVTYGGVTMTEVTGSPLLHAGEIAGVYAYFLGSSIPTGAQTVQVNYRAGGTSFLVPDCISVTATGDTALETQGTIDSASVANPTANLTIDEDSWLALVFASGAGAVTGTTPSAGWTSRREVDFGTQVSGVYTKDANVSTTTAFGWTQVADDAAAIGVAVKEASAPPPSTFKPQVMVVV